jgi:hypothetical protein
VRHAGPSRFWQILHFVLFEPEKCIPKILIFLRCRA